MNPENDGPDEWGSRGREHQARRVAARTSQGEAYATWLESLPVAAAAIEIRSLFAETATQDLAGEIAGDLQLDPEKAGLIAQEIAASRQRLEHATRPLHRRGEPTDNEAG